MSSITRLNLSSLKMLLLGTLPESHKCVIKFYSETCQICTDLAPVYKDIASDHTAKDTYFFAFNTSDAEDADFEELRSAVVLKGVPSIVKFNTGVKDVRVSVMEEPIVPDPITWYTRKDIINFIEGDKTNEK